MLCSMRCVDGYVVPVSGTYLRIKAEGSHASVEHGCVYAPPHARRIFMATKKELEEEVKWYAKKANRYQDALKDIRYRMGDTDTDLFLQWEIQDIVNSVFTERK